MERKFIRMNTTKPKDEFETVPLTDPAFLEAERQRQKALEEYRKQAMEQWFEDGSCTGGDLKNK